MEWTDIRLTVAKADADNAEAVATMIAEGGIYIEDYSDIEQQVAEIAHVDLIEQELLDKPRDTVIIHMYLEPGASPVETLALIAARMEAANIAYTVETEGVEQEDWQNGWRKYYHPLEIGKRLAVVPSWQQYDTDRVKLILDPGLAFGTGGHETTSLCMEALDERVTGGERVLDIGTGSGILAIAALKLGAADYLLKPFHDGELEETIARIRSRAQAAAPAASAAPVLPEGQGPEKSKYVREALAYLSEHYNDPDISVSSVARSLGVSDGHLSHVFKKETSYTLSAYLTNYRMHKATELLRDCRVKVYEVAESVGYRDIAYFSSAFKKSVGMSPSEYQKRCQ